MFLLKVFIFLGLVFSGFLIIIGIAMIADGELGGGLAVLLIFGALFFIFLKSISIVEKSDAKKKKTYKNEDDQIVHSNDDLESERLLEEYRIALKDNKNNNQSELDELKRRIQRLERDNEILTSREIQRIEKENKGVSGWTFFKWIFVIPVILGIMWAYRDILIFGGS